MNIEDLEQSFLVQSELSTKLAENMNKIFLSLNKQNEVLSAVLTGQSELLKLTNSMQAHLQVLHEELLDLKLRSQK